MKPQLPTRIKYKCFNMIYKTLNDLGPTYLTISSHHSALTTLHSHLSSASSSFLFQELCPCCHSLLFAYLTHLYPTDLISKVFSLERPLGAPKTKLGTLIILIQFYFIFLTLIICN